VQHEQIRGRVRVVEDVVHLRREVIDVLAVERRDERGVQRAHHGVRDLVTDVLAVLDRRGPRLRVVVRSHHRQEQLSGFHDVLRGLLEELEEPLLAGERA
jgi:hypothetical protein